MADEKPIHEKRGRRTRMCYLRHTHEQHSKCSFTGFNSVMFRVRM